jgi:hypothetical protein
MPSSTITPSVSAKTTHGGQPGLLEQADVGQRREEHHRALREVEDAGRLVDQHEAERDERVHHAREQAADQDFEEEMHVSAPPRDRRR